MTALRARTHAVGRGHDVLRRLPVVARRARSSPRSPRAAPRRRRRSPRICSLSTGSGSAPSCRCSGSTSGRAPPPRRAITALLPAGARLTQNPHTYLDAQLIFAGLPRQDARAVPAAERGRDARPRHVRRRLGVHRADARARRRPAGSSRVIEARQAAGGSGVLLLDAQGGAIDDAAAGETSFIHREHALVGADPQLRQRRGHGRAPSASSTARAPCSRRSATARRTRTTPTRT